MRNPVDLRALFERSRQHSIRSIADLVVSYAKALPFAPLAMRRLRFAQAQKEAPEDQPAAGVYRGGSEGSPMGRVGERAGESVWNRGARNELRHIVLDQLQTRWGEPPRSERVHALLGGSACGSGRLSAMQSDQGSGENTTEAVLKLMRDDIERSHAHSLLRDLLAHNLRLHGCSELDVEAVGSLLEGVNRHRPKETREALKLALRQSRSAYCLLLTAAAATPIVVADADADATFADGTADRPSWSVPMSGTVDAGRSDLSVVSRLQVDVDELLGLRRSHPALQRQGIAMFYRHPGMDHDGQPRVFAYCRTGGQPLGSRGQVAVVASLSSHAFPEFHISWHWGADVREHVKEPDTIAAQFDSTTHTANVPLLPYCVRVFTT